MVIIFHHSLRGKEITMDGAFHSAQVCVSERWKGAGGRGDAGECRQGDGGLGSGGKGSGDGGGGGSVGATAGKQANHAFSQATHEAVLK